jgi:hypothetical protein
VEKERRKNRKRKRKIKANGWTDRQTDAKRKKEKHSAKCHEHKFEICSDLLSSLRDVSSSPSSKYWTRFSNIFSGIS